jgi:hypothetical protein
VLEYDVSGVEVVLDRASESLGCSWVRPDQLARLWTAEGAWSLQRNEPDAAKQSFAAAHRVNPGVWPVDYGSKVQAIFDASLAPEAGEALITLDLGDGGWDLRVDGAPAVEPLTLAPGLHAIQVGEYGRTATFGQVVLASAGATLELRTELFHAPPPELSSDLEGSRTLQDLLALLRDGKLSGVERKYVDLVREHPQSLPPFVHQAGATASRSRGDLLTTVRRLRRIDDPTLDADRDLQRLESSTALVLVESRGPLRREGALFDPSLQRSILLADEALRETGVFMGLLPAGRYDMGGRTVELPASRALVHVGALP